MINAFLVFLLGLAAIALWIIKAENEGE